MKISIIIPCYEASKFVGRAIRSALDQTHHDLELVVIDDFSTDNSSAIVESMAKKDNRIILLRNRINMGPSSTRNKGIRESTGDLLCFLDADDVFLPSRVERMVRSVELGKDAFSCTDIFTMDESERVIRDSYSSHLPPDGKAHAWFLTKEFQGHGTIMISRKHVARIGFFDESLRWAEDFDYNLRLSREFEVTVVREPLYGYRKHPASYTSQHSVSWRKRINFSVLSKQLEISRFLVDDETRYRTIRRLLRYAKEAHSFASYAKLVSDPIFLKVAARNVVRKV